ncbi:MAG: site-specific DNA-methyltransferase [Deltaproteobacteria bacterium]|nr:site-specific DNA-methyltransferase [Deltaproteobacteria bacterium]
MSGSSPRRRRGSARRSTATSSFGVGRREAHDSREFYARFHPPEVSADEQVTAPPLLEEPLICGDARRMAELPDGCVALVVTSPPYFVGKEYEEAVGRGHVPASYLDYLALLRDVFAACKEKLEPGGRIAVNVANLGRRPYRSLSADVIRILQDDLQLLLRGEIIWRKAAGASGSCAWGSFCSPANPVLRDLSERVIVASKGRFDRAGSPARRRQQGLPCEATLTADEFMAATLDVWDIPPESARRVGHPAPFPVELPQRLIGLYTFRGDLVLDPFLGSGSTAVAARRTGRRFAGYDVDPRYVALAHRRVAAEFAGEQQDQLELGLAGCCGGAAESVEEAPGQPGGRGGEEQGAPGRGTAAAIAEELLVGCGFTIVARKHRLPRLGLGCSLVAADRRGERWYFDVNGTFTIAAAGLLRSEEVWQLLGRALVLGRQGLRPLVVLAPRLPRPKSSGDLALRAAGPQSIFDAIELLSPAGQQRLRRYAAGGAHLRPLPGFWPG